uniref:Cullin domain-containing protein n=1 Tax=Macrostomum lignano TaxID=282301 RepID=A0A1I8FES2_9PLAT
TPGRNPSPQLDTSVYDLVLNEVVAEDLSRQPNDQILNRCLARLYELLSVGEHEKTLSILLKLRSCDAFALAAAGSTALHSTCGWLLHQLHHLRAVIEFRRCFCDYLDAVHLKDPARVEKHADKMVELYADHAQAEAAAVPALVERLQLTEETVYILARMGRRAADALNLLLDEQQVQFCRDEAGPGAVDGRRRGPASDRPRLITTLLENSGSEVGPGHPHPQDPARHGGARPQKLHCEAAQATTGSRSPAPPNVCVSPSSNLCVRCRTPLLVARRMGEAPPDAGEAAPAAVPTTAATTFHAECRQGSEAAAVADTDCLRGLISVASALRLLWQGSHHLPRRHHALCWQPLSLSPSPMKASPGAAAPLPHLQRRGAAVLRAAPPRARPSCVGPSKSLKSEILEACLASWLRRWPDSPELARTLGEARRAVDCAADGLLARLEACGRPALAARLLRLACRFWRLASRAIDEGEGESGGWLLARLLARPPARRSRPGCADLPMAAFFARVAPVQAEPRPLLHLAAAVNTGLTHLLPPQEAACGPLAAAAAALAVATAVPTCLLRAPHSCPPAARCGPPELGDRPAVVFDLPGDCGWDGCAEDGAAG